MHPETRHHSREVPILPDLPRILRLLGGVSSSERLRVGKGGMMINRAEIRSAYARTRCAWMQSQFVFRWLLLELMENTRDSKATGLQLLGLRETLEIQRQILRSQLRTLMEIRKKAQRFPGLLDRAIEDSYRLFSEQSR